MDQLTKFKLIRTYLQKHFFEKMIDIFYKYSWVWITNLIRLDG